MDQIYNNTYNIKNKLNLYELLNKQLFQENKTEIKRHKVIDKQFIQIFE